ncbi:MAG TPA: haloacid dehalogenase type II [Terriglobia bacterium]|nr:haloacid dehalogenase type II [Terriglobia bacterium]
MINPPLHGIRACVFDAYGTLFDVASAASRCRDALGVKLDRLNSLWRDKQLQYSWLRELQGARVDFWQITGDALDFALDSLDIKDAGLRDRLMSLYLELELFPDVRETLNRLMTSGYRTAILSNGSPSMLRALVDHNGIGHLLDDVFSVEDAGVYKPHPKTYGLAIERLGVDRHSILFLSANAWDAHAASAFGMRVAWCNRIGQCRERLPGGPDFEVRSLAEVHGIIGA